MVPFARELAAHLAHCAKAGTVVEAADYERSPFAAFFHTLNEVIADRRFTPADNEAGAGGEWSSEEEGGEVDGVAGAFGSGIGRGGSGQRGSFDDDVADDPVTR